MCTCSNHRRPKLATVAAGDYDLKLLLVMSVLHWYAPYLKSMSSCKPCNVRIIVIGHQEASPASCHCLKQTLMIQLEMSVQTSASPFAMTSRIGRVYEEGGSPLISVVIQKLQSINHLRTRCDRSTAQCGGFVSPKFSGYERDATPRPFFAVYSGRSDPRSSAYDLRSK